MVSVVVYRVSRLLSKVMAFCRGRRLKLVLSSRYVPPSGRGTRGAVPVDKAGAEVAAGGGAFKKPADGPAKAGGGGRVAGLEAVLGNAVEGADACRLSVIVSIMVTKHIVATADLDHGAKTYCRLCPWQGYIALEVDVHGHVRDLVSLTLCESVMVQI